MQGVPNICASPKELGLFSIDDGQTNTLAFKYSDFICSALRLPVNMTFPLRSYLLMSDLIYFPYPASLTFSTIDSDFVISVPATRIWASG